MRNSSHVGFWFAVAMVLFLLTPLFRSGPEMALFAQREIEVTHEALGEKLGGGITRYAYTLFDQSPIQTVVKGLNTARQVEQKDRRATELMGSGAKMISGTFDVYTSGLLYEAYIVCVRFMVVLAWLAILAPFLAVAAYDGFKQRAIKFEEFGKLRPSMYTMAGMVVIPMLAAPLIYLVLPFSVNPLLAPVWAACVALPLSLLVANMQPIFGRN
jgi:hypothetical protein